MFTHDLFTFVRLLILVLGLFGPGGFGNLSIRLRIGIDRLGETGKKAVGSLMGKISRVPEGDLSRLLGVIDQGTGSKEVL